MDRSVHISYDVSDHENRTSLREALFRSVEEARERSGQARERFRILDCGCGLGLMMRDLKAAGYVDVSGIDIDPVCLESAKAFGAVTQGTIDDLVDLFDEDRFDLVILSHVLEHLVDPISSLRTLSYISARWVVVAVPNPLDLHLMLKHALFRRDASNKGHVYSWDHSHFQNFLERHCGLRIAMWEVDRVKFVPLSPLRRLLKRLRLLTFLEERWAPSLLPFFSTSLIALAEVNVDERTGQPD